jgi:hypothetical protein
MGRQPRTPCRERTPALVDELLEAVGIELPRLDPKHITGGTRDENALGLVPPAPTSQSLAKLRDVDLDDLRGRRRRTVAPELVDQAIGGDDLVAVKEQNGEHRALLRSAEGDLTSLRADLERPEDPKLHLSSASVTRADSRHNRPADPLPPLWQCFVDALPPGCTLRETDRMKRSMRKGADREA